MSSPFVKLCTAQYVTQMSVLLLLYVTGSTRRIPSGLVWLFGPCVPVFSHSTDFKYCILWSRAACTESSLVVDVIVF